MRRAHFSTLEVVVIISNLEEDAYQVDERYEISDRESLLGASRMQRWILAHRWRFVVAQVIMSLTAIRNKPPVSVRASIKWSYHEAYHSTIIHHIDVFLLARTSERVSP